MTDTTGFYWQLDNTSGDLSARLLDDLSRATMVHMTAPWITQGPLLKVLTTLARQEVPVVVRVGGLQDYVTTPEALQALLNAKSVITMVWTTDQKNLFHPKIYYIRQQLKQILWIGSQNPTGSAFSNNCEAAIRVEKPDKSIVNPVEKFLKKIDERSRRLTQALVDNYRAKWRKGKQERNKQRQKARRMIRGIASRISKSKLSEISWRNYYRALIDRDREIIEMEIHRKRRVDASILFDKDYSYLDTIEETRDILLYKPFSDIDKFDCRRILGEYDRAKEQWNYGLLGRIKAKGVFTRAFQQNMNGFRNRILSICRDDSLWSDKKSTLKGVLRLTELDNCGMAIASRIGAIIRPDLVVSANMASVKRLSHWSNIAWSSIVTGRFQGYSKLLEFVWDSKWFSQKPHRSATEKEKRCYRARCALLDLFMYDESPKTKLLT